SFFGGYNDFQPLIWSKDDYAGDIMLEAYMGIKMDLPGPPFYLHPSDLCLSIGGDGQDVTSGYSFLYAARNNTCSLLYRNGQEIARNDSAAARFPATGWDNETQGNKFHRHWFHVVLRKVGRRVVCSVDDAVLFDVPDDGSVTSGKIAVYSVNNGVMVARVRAWYEQRAPREPFPDLGALQAEAAAEAGPADVDPYQNDFERGLGSFAQEFARVPVLLQREPTENGRCLTVTNLRAGDKFAITAVGKPFKLAERGRLGFRYKIPPGVRLNLYAVSRGTWHIIRLTGGEQADTGQKLLGAVAGVKADDQWHQASLDLREAFKPIDSSGQLTIDRLVLGMLEPEPYYHAGFGCNAYGSRYSLDDFVLAP
ncbi:MAG: hypothetical protein HUU35_07750, partial [Armatimonadetes bacterium]|nr:hypothetical protein [Armatimonadota bacterium]